MIDTILKRGDQLVTFPKLGREIDRYNRPGIRELIEAPYRIIYRVHRYGSIVNQDEDFARVKVSNPGKVVNGNRVRLQCEREIE